MGVIEWKEQDGIFIDALVGNVRMARIDTTPRHDGKATWWNEALLGFEGDAAEYYCWTVDEAKSEIEEDVERWMEKGGIISKTELDITNEAYSALYVQYRTRISQSLETAKDLQKAQAEVERLERVLKKIRREIDCEEDRDIYCRFMKIVDDAHDWAADPAPKRRTEADFRNADIDANGYVTFRDGGAPDGWQLVPVEPTFEMAKAAIHLDPKCDLDAKYRAMLVAAPRYVGGEA